MTVKGWLCVIHHNNWEIVRRRQIYALHRNCREYSLKNMKLMRKGDIIVLYVTKPISGIVGIFEVTSEGLADPQEPDYPYVVKIEPSKTEIKTPISIHTLVGKISQIKTKTSIQGRAIIPLSQQDVKVIQSMLPG